jgi:hypothetical protein
VAVRTAFPFVDDALRPFADALGRDHVAYRHHVARLLNFLFALAPGLRDAEQVAVAAAFHDLGIWTDRSRRSAGPTPWTSPSARSARGCPRRSCGRSARRSPTPASTPGWRR